MSVQGIKTKVVYSSSFDPWYNLALEEMLLRRVEKNEVVLYLWQNDKTVVIGRNQNAWKECRCQQLENEGGKLARRLSGGGAVYHDLGNLNFTFLVDRKHYDLERQLEVILQAVNRLGVKAEFSGRNDLTVRGKKFSGNAFYFEGNVALHHGTVLVGTDFSNLVRYLQVSREKISSKGIDSVQARVVNLGEIDQSITTDAVRESIRTSFIDLYGEPASEVRTDGTMGELQSLYNKYASWQWRYGQTPDFDISFQKRFTWGEIDMRLSLQDGHITSAVIYSDAMDSLLIQEIAAALKGLPFQMKAIVQRVGSISCEPDQKPVITDLQEWLMTKAG